LIGLEPAPIETGLCVLTYRVSTRSAQCQALFDQGLAYLYSYVWMEAARSFETATRHDPDCALAWWGLSRALDGWCNSETARPLLSAKELEAMKAHERKALRRADELRGRASHREQQLILARVQEKGLDSKSGDTSSRKQAAIATIDAMLALYDDDQEAWYYRAQLAGGSDKPGGRTSSVPFYKALLRLNPLHPGANHEMIHYYELSERPALGWSCAERYLESSPGIPHAFHMQAHLATRLGRWEKTSDRSARAVELERAYHRRMKVRPRDDHQFSHHLQILTWSLIHDGRFREARAVEQEAGAAGFKHWLPWFRLHVAERDWPAALKIVEQLRGKEPATANYMAALVYLRQNNAGRARQEVDALAKAHEKKKDDREQEYRCWETRGLLLTQTGDVAAGLALLAQAADRSRTDYTHHAWGNGSYYMEVWGATALSSGKLDQAEEAFLEALAHDPGCARAALGLRVLCERQGRTEEANRYHELARRCWRRAEVGTFDAELAALRQEGLPQRAQRNREEPQAAGAPPMLGGGRR
jgi:tetratricopeptide (TPR) repeat protein